LIFFSVVALLAADWLPTAGSTLWTRVVPGCAVALSVAFGLLMRVSVVPGYWRWMCRARNAALSAAVLLVLVDLVVFVWFVVALNESGGFP
jgi:hypothetical protein